MDALYLVHKLLHCTICRDGGEPSWRNWIARWTSNPKVVGSSPAGGTSLSKDLCVNIINCFVHCLHIGNIFPLKLKNKSKIK